MPDTSSQIIVKRFAECFNRKFTNTIFKKELGCANSLLKAGFSEEDIIMCIEYLSKHPPLKGVKSIAYLQYVINDVLSRAKVERMKEETLKIRYPDLPENEDNKSKYERQERYTVKGTKNIFGGE